MHSTVECIKSRDDIFLSWIECTINNAHSDPHSSETSFFSSTPWTFRRQSLKLRAKPPPKTGRNPPKRGLFIQHVSEARQCYICFRGNQQLGGSPISLTSMWLSLIVELETWDTQHLMFICGHCQHISRPGTRLACGLDGMGWCLMLVDPGWKNHVKNQKQRKHKRKTGNVNITTILWKMFLVDIKTWTILLCSMAHEQSHLEYHESLW